MKNLKTILLLSGLCITSVSQAQKVGDFIFEKEIDLISDDDISYFYATALNSEDSASYAPKLIFGCRNKRAYINIDGRRTLATNTDNDTVVRIRFDQNKPSDYLFWPRTKDIYVATIPATELEDFTKNALKSEQVVIQFNVSEGKVAQFQFGLNRLEFMVKKLVCAKEFLGL